MPSSRSPRPLLAALVGVLALLASLLVGAVPGALPGASAVPAGTAPTSSRTTAAGQVSAGGEHTCAVHADATLWCWGRNTYGQLGNGNHGPGTATPQQVPGTGWQQVSAGGATTCALKASGPADALYCWGLDHRGQLGDGSTHARTAPFKVSLPKKSGTHGPGWKSVATGWFDTCGIRGDSSLWCWGDNTAGQLGQGTTRQDRALHRVAGTWRSVAVQGWNVCAIRTDGSLWCWGRNTFGQLGNGTSADRSRPTQVGGSHTWKQVALSWTHACGVQGAGVVKCWGRNDLGQVGDPTRTYVTKPFTVPGGHPAASVAVAEGSSCLVDTSGTPWCWGDNRYGQVSPSAPVTPGSRTPVARTGSVSGVSGGWFHLCAETSSGTPTCWGSDGHGQLGASTPAPGRAVAKPAAPTVTPGPLTLRLASFNTLGNHHTQPGRDADNFPPASLRADWESQIILNNGIDVAGIEEQDAGQLAGIIGGAGGRLASFPTPAAGDLGVETTVVWNTADYKAVKTELVRMPFIARDLRRPVVELQQLSTGRRFWVMAVHNAPWNYQSKRNAETKIEIAKLKQLEATGLPVFFVGDFNEKASLFCKVLKGTDLGSASGGRISGSGACQPPRQMRVDWIFGSKALVNWSGFAFTKPPLARLSTDHFIPVVDVTAP